MPNVLYIAGDTGIQVTIDKGKTWTNFSTAAPDVVVRDLFIQKRDRDLVIGTYGRGIYIADIAPLKEFKPETLPGGRLSLRRRGRPSAGTAMIAKASNTASSPRSTIRRSERHSTSSSRPTPRTSS